MTVFLLIRHGHNPAVGHRITGRLPGVHLDRQGMEQAEGIAARLAALPLAAVCSSPLERTMETAAPLARSQGLEIEVCERLQEVEFGEWSGRSFEDLAPLPLWRQFNRFRAGTRPPGGELMVEVQARMVAEIERLRHTCPGGVVALVGHGDPLRAAIAHYAGIPLGSMLRFEVSLASISILEIDQWGAKLLCLNHTGDSLPYPAA